MAPSKTPTNQMSSSAPPVILVSSFAAAVWLLARGHEPLSAVFNPVRQGVEFLFHKDAKAAWTAYHDAKEKLSLMALQAKEQA